MKSLIFSMDYNHQPLNIADFILHLLVCSVLCNKNNLECVDVNIISDPRFMHTDPQLRSLLSHSNKKRKIYDIIQMLQLLPKVRCINFHDVPVESIDTFICNTDQGQVYWPPLEKLRIHGYMFYDAVQFLSNYIIENKAYPYLEFSEYQTNYALQFYKNHAYPNVPVTVNLRGNKFFHGHRNALLNEWKHFFIRVANTYPVKFFIVGSFGEIDPEIAELDNVVYAKQYCTSIVDDMSLLSNSAFHLGNASGPSLLIYFSDKPYYIFNCDMKPHAHAYRGALLVNPDSLQYAFATPHQNFGIVPETADEIYHQFEKIWNSRDWMGWASEYFYKRTPVDIPYWF